SIGTVLHHSFHVERASMLRATTEPDEQARRPWRARARSEGASMTTTPPQIVDLRRQTRPPLDPLETSKGATEQEPPRMFTAEEQASWDAAEAEVHTIDRKTDLLKGIEQEHAMNARPIANPMQPTLAMPGRIGDAKTFPGQAFVRLVGALALSK